MDIEIRIVREAGTSNPGSIDSPGIFHVFAEDTHYVFTMVPLQRWRALQKGGGESVSCGKCLS